MWMDCEKHRGVPGTLGTVELSTSGENGLLSPVAEAEELGRLSKVLQQENEFTPTYTQSILTQKKEFLAGTHCLRLDLVRKAAAICPGTAQFSSVCARQLRTSHPNKRICRVRAGHIKTSETQLMHICAKHHIPPETQNHIDSQTLTAPLCVSASHFPTVCTNVSSHTQFALSQCVLTFVVLL